MATRKRTSTFGISLFTFALLSLVVVETLWLAAFIYSEGSAIPAAISAAFGGHKKEEKAKAPSLQYSEHAIAGQKGKEKTPEKEKKEPVAVATPKHKGETAIAATPTPKTGQTAVAVTPTPAPTATSSKKVPEGVIATKDDQEMQNLLSREGSKGKSAASGDGL